MQILNTEIASNAPIGAVIGFILGVIIFGIVSASIEGLTLNTGVALIVGLVLGITTFISITFIPKWGYEITVEAVVEDYNVVYEEGLEVEETSGELTTLTLSVYDTEQVAEEKLQALIDATGGDTE